MREISIPTLSFVASRDGEGLWKTRFGRWITHTHLTEFVDLCWKAGNAVTIDGRVVPPPGEFARMEANAVYEHSGPR